MKRATVRLLCPAKVNLALSVGGVDDDGYHNICSWMVAVSLFDELVVEKLDDGKRNGEKSRFVVEWCDDNTLGVKEGELEGEWAIEDDIVYRVHQALEERAGRKLGIDVTLCKRIPAGAGLGGGSSDGAGMVKAINELFELGMSRGEMVDVAMEVGSDLAFFFGSGSSVVGGRGEKVRDVAAMGEINLVLIIPRFGCSTGEVYGAFDVMCGSNSRGSTIDEERVEKAAETWPICDEVLFNDLAEAACDVNGELGVLRARCAEITERAVHITGSGSCIFLVASGAGDAENIAAKLDREEKIRTCVVSAVGIEGG